MKALRDCNGANDRWGRGGAVEDWCKSVPSGASDYQTGGSSKRVKQEGQARESSKRSSEKSRPDESWTLQRGVATESSMQVIDVERRHCQINPDERALDR